VLSFFFSGLIDYTENGFFAATFSTAGLDGFHYALINRHATIRTTLVEHYVDFGPFIPRKQDLTIAAVIDFLIRF
jgi:hypothetical protein